MDNEEIIEKIIEYSQDIFLGLVEKERESRLFSDYISLCSYYSQGNMGHDFEELYRGYWGMNNAGLTPKHFKIYFEMLRAGENNLYNILEALYNIPRLNGTPSIQFAFATKLLHTLNNNKPIFDRWIGSVFWGNNTFNDNAPLDERIQNRVERYNELCGRYQELLRVEDLQSIIKEFRRRFEDLAQGNDNFQWNNQIITDTRVLDFIIWELGQLLNGPRRY